MLRAEIDRKPHVMEVVFVQDVGDSTVEVGRSKELEPTDSAEAHVHAALQFLGITEKQGVTA